MQWDWVGDTLIGVRGWYIGEIVKKYGRYEWTLRIVNNPPFISGVNYNENDAIRDVQQAFTRDLATMIG